MEHILEKAFTPSDVQHFPSNLSILFNGKRDFFEKSCFKEYKKASRVITSSIDFYFRISFFRIFKCV